MFSRSGDQQTHSDSLLWGEQWNVFVLYWKASRMYSSILSFWAVEMVIELPRARDVNHIPFFWPIIKVLWLLKLLVMKEGNHPWWPSNLIIPDQLSNDTANDRKLLKFLSRRWPLYEQPVQESEGSSCGEWTSHLGLTYAQVSPISRRLGCWSWRSQCTFI